MMLQNVTGLKKNEDIIYIGRNNYLVFFSLSNSVLFFSKTNVYEAKIYLEIFNSLLIIMYKYLRIALALLISNVKYRTEKFL